jgi:hypothetical protein
MGPTLSTGKEAWLKHVRADGRIHGGIIPIGTPHSRAKHSQVPNPKKGKPFSAECRALFRSNDGWVFVAADQAGLQDRGFAHYLHPHDGGAYGKTFGDGTDTHWKTVIALELVPSGTKRAKDNKLHTALREGAKTFRYAFIFGAQAARAGQIIYGIARSALQLDPASNLHRQFFGGTARPPESKLRGVGGKARKRFIDNTPGLAQLKQKLEKQANRYGWVPGLDGRRVPVRALYTALNYIITASEAVVCKRWLVQVYDELCARFRYGWDGDVVLVLWVHDELVACCRPEIADQVGEIMARHGREAGEFYGFRVPLEADYKIGRAWAEAPESPAVETKSLDEAQPSFSHVNGAAVLPPLSEPPAESEVSEIEAPMPTLPAHICARCKLDPPDGTERLSVYNDLWLHSRCEDDLMDERLVEEGILDAIPEPELSPPQQPSTPPPATGNGYKWSDDEGKPSGNRRIGQRVATYLYRDHLGGPHTRVEKWRISGKHAQYPQKFWSGGCWVDKKPSGWRKIPYRLPELLAALTKSTALDVHLPEGEKDAETLVKLGLIATTSSEGASNPKRPGNWTPELNKWFYGVGRVFIPEDNDEPGRCFAREKACALTGIVPEIRIVNFPDVPPGQDVSYWLDELKHSKEEYLARCEAAPRWSTELESVRAADLDMENYDWLWPGRFALGEIGMFVGMPDVGKGQILAYIAGRVTRELAWPNDEGQAPLGNLLLLTSEDNLKKTIIPRLEAAGADLERVHILKMVGDTDPKTGKSAKRMLNVATDLERSRAKILTVGNVKVVQIDPLTAYLGVGKVDSYRTSDVRAVLGPLKDLAEELSVAIIGVMHFNKKIDIHNVMLRASDSLAFVAAPRHVFGVIHDPENDRTLVVSAKNNLAEAAQKRKSLAYHFEAKKVGTDRKGEPIEAPFIVWEPGYVDISATEALSAVSGNRSPSALEDAKDFLRGRLVTGSGRAPQAEIEEAADAEGISEKTLRRAKKALGIKAEKDKVANGPWYWIMPDAEEGQF